MKRITLLALALAVLPLAAPAFSPAENATRLEPELHLAHLAYGKTGAVAALKALPRPEKADKLLASAGIGALRLFTLELDGRTLVFSHHTVRTGKSIEEAWNRAMDHKTLGPWLDQVVAQLDPGPGAPAGQTWRSLEQVFYHRGPADRVPAAGGRSFAAITGLKPEMEMQYRTLHQTSWPGVLAALDRSHVANFSVYLVEAGEQLYLFYYFDYVGTDFEADMAAMGQDAVTRRWWKFTDACQQPLPAAAAQGKIWTDLVPLGHP